MKNILIVDDKADIRELLSDIISDEGYFPISVGKASEAIKVVQEQHIDAVILDIWLEGSEFDGIGVLKSIKTFKKDVPVIMISGHGNIETAVNTIKLGAYDFIEKPFKSERLILLLKRALSAYSLYIENQNLKKTLNSSNEVIGTSKLTKALIKNVQTAGSSNSRVLIEGELGVGKDTIAHMLHTHSARHDRPLISISSLDLTEDNFDRIIYGIEPHEKSCSIVSRAHGGTLYLSELESLSETLQPKLLKLLQDTSIDIRFITSTNKDLKAMVEAGSFSSSLYYRVNVICITISPLRQRKEDIQALLEYYTTLFSNTYKHPTLSFTPKAITALETYKWPGNLIELKNLVERLVIMNDTHTSSIDICNLPNDFITNITHNKADNSDWLLTALSKPLKEAKDDFERFYLTNQLSKFEWNISKTADNIGIDRTALHRKLKSLEVANN